jgi:hypothetical protein
MSERSERIIDTGFGEASQRAASRDVDQAGAPTS